MAANGFYVEGRQFRIRADYEAALRDKAAIDRIRQKIDFTNSEEVFQLYEEMQAGAYRFETIVGNDFDDEIFELVERIKKEQRMGKPQPAPKAKKKNKNKEKEVKIENFDEEMQKQILAELKKHERNRKLTVVLCSLVAVCCFGYFAIYYYFSDRTSSTYDEWSQLIQEDTTDGIVIKPSTVTLTETETPDVLEKYKTLLNKNKSLIGWLKIDDTNIDYPVMQTVNNDYYLDHNLDQKYDKNGSIFMDKDCDVIEPSTNLIIYGHHMKSGKMFGNLDKYSKKSYYEEHPMITFDTIYEEGTYQIMYVFRSRIYSADEIVFKYYQFIDANSEEEFDSYMQEMSKISLYDTGITATYGDRLITLSTCDSSEEDGRFVVVAKKVD